MLVEELDAVVLVRIVRGADHDAELAAELLRHVGDAGRRQRPDQVHVDAGSDEARLQRSLEHVAGKPRVLADERRAALRRQHARRGARQPQRELDRHRVPGRPGRARRRCRNTFCPSAARSCRDALPAARATVQSSVRPSRLVAAQRDRHFDRIDRGGDVVRADDRRPRLHRKGGQRRRCPPAARRGWPTRHDTDERLARDADQQRIAQIREASAGFAAVRRCAGRSCRTRCRDRYRSSRRDARRRGRRGARGKKLADFGDDVVVARRRLHGRRLALHVHHADGGVRAPLRPRARPAAQRANVVDEVRAGPQRGRDHFGLAGVDGKHGVGTGGERLDHRHDAIDFLLRADRCRARARRLAADVDDGRALLDHAQSGRDRGLPVEVPAAVRE